jgi:hypothetical protein
MEGEERTTHNYQLTTNNLLVTLGGFGTATSRGTEGLSREATCALKDGGLPRIVAKYGLAVF